MIILIVEYNVRTYVGRHKIKEFLKVWQCLDNLTLTCCYDLTFC